LAPISLLLVASIVPPAPALAPDKNWVEEDDFYDPGTCSGACDSPEDAMTATDLATTPNILVIVADDQSYCQFGFMAGYCYGNAHRSCQSDFDCGDDGPCLTDADGTEHDPGKGGGTLRLNDPACRFRQRPAPKAKRTCVKNQDPNHVGHKGGDRVAYPFGRSEFPCAATKTYDTNHPVYSTPHLDRLVQDGGVLFTRAYVSGNQCKTSRSSMTFGRHHRHNKWQRDNAVPDHPIGEALETTDYVRIVMGKLEVIDEPSDAGFDRGQVNAQPRVGRFSCKGDEGICREAACAIHDDSVSPAALCPVATSSEVDEAAFPMTPKFAHESAYHGSVANLFDLVFKEGVSADATGEQVLLTEEGADVGIAHPFLLWLAPKAPHKGNYAGALRDLFTGHGVNQEKHMARVAQMDLTVGAIINELKASCVCVDDAQTSLWNHTVVLYLADHGFQMYEAKRNAHESNHRAPLIVSLPANRGGGPTVVDDELASTLDVYQTVLGFAGANLPPNTPEFLYGRNLRARIEGTSSDPIRKAVYGEWAKPKKENFGVAGADERSFYMIPRPKEVGVCTAGASKMVTVPKPCYHDADCSGSCNKKKRRCSTDTTEHARPCLVGNECGTGGTCSSGTTTGRCVNNPEKTCTLGGANSQCYDAGTLCDPTAERCRYDLELGSFGEFAIPTPASSNPHANSVDCSTGGDAACIPQDVVLCQPLLLKIQADGKTAGDDVVIAQAWDLRWDPDQHQDLISLDAGYLGSLTGPASGTLGRRARDCLRDFWRLTTVAGEPRWLAPTGGECGAWAEPTTTTTTSSSSTSTTSTTI
jgi:arylsulfatase A-like enzyme